MRKIILAALITSATSLYAAENEANKTEDTTVNPITGTETTTKVEEAKKTYSDGSVAKAKKKVVTKKKTDGSVSRKVENEKSLDVHN